MVGSPDLFSLINLIKFLNITKNECYEYFSSFEINTNIGLNLINKFYDDIPIPFDNQYSWYAIAELSSYDNVNLEKKISNIIDQSIRNKIILDALVGAILLGGLSYVTSHYKDKSTSTKIIAYLWSAPLTYFYLLNIVSRQGPTLVNDFNNHALIGLIITLFVSSGYNKSSLNVSLIFFLNL